MSAFDGISSASELLQRSKDFNAPAIAIADRCNVQAYPDLFNDANRLKQKTIYGVELDVQKDIIQLVQNATNQKIADSDYIIFDIETTGLYNEFEELIEFAGVKIHNNIVVDQLQFFVKSEKEIPAKITNLTHITNEMVKNADSIKVALKRITE
jgi:DNA polymerase-3 subunit alpha (Gram-positive type)